MDLPRYHAAVAENRREHGLDAVDGPTGEFDPVWATRGDDDSIGEVAVLATLVDDPEPDPESLVRTGEAFRDVLADRTAAASEQADGGESPTSIGYVTLAVSDPDPSLLDAMSGFTVARRRTCVFPLVYNLAAERLHRHEVPRLKGRGIYRRQAEDAERLFGI